MQIILCTYFKNYLFLVIKKAGVFITMSAVGICASSSCVDVTKRQQESAGEREGGKGTGLPD